MVRAEIQIKNSSGIHVRPASVLNKIARQCGSQVVIITGEKRIDPKSILILLGAGIKKDTTVTIECTGETEEQDLSRLLEAIESGLGEEG